MTLKKGFRGMQCLRFDTGFQCFKYAFLVVAHKPLRDDASRIDLDSFAINGGLKFLKVDFICLHGQYPVTLKGINIFERANEHLKIDATVLQYDTEFEKYEWNNKKGVISPMSAKSIESMEWVLYKPASETTLVGHFLQ